MKSNLALTLLVLAIGAVLLTSAQVPDLSNYPFRATLLDDRDQGQYYALYWNFSLQAGTIHFAVNVSTTGWVGLGISPNGQMPGSDVVIAWVADDGTPYVTDRFADFRSLPPYDSSQDWFVISGVEENGLTILEFSRNLTTCDDRDLEVVASTSRVVWSFQANDPSDPLGNTANMHDRQGSSSLNLLGGLVNPPPPPDDVMTFDIRVSDVGIPHSSDTTYWCQSVQLPDEFLDVKRYITRFSPVITPNGRSFVHHMLVYLCPYDLTDPADIGASASCDDGVSDRVSGCRSGLLIAGWAVGGEDFIYPENVAYPVGGPGARRYAVIEMHYDNPELQQGVVDSSGVTFFYTSMVPQHEAGILFLGHSVPGGMVIPPQVENYTVAALCPAQCTNAFFPEGGIKVFGNLLHTHLAGHGLTMRHLRWNPECEVMEELEPIDQNLRYDFNYQQFTHLSKEFTVLPNDTLILECFYDTTDRSNVTQGGERTHEEMCLIFAVYYPRPEGTAMDMCVSNPLPNIYNDFFTRHYEGNEEAVNLLIEQRFTEGLNAFNWASPPNVTSDFENATLRGGIGASCRNEAGIRISEDFPKGLPEVGCAYQAPNNCNPQEAEPCCVGRGGAIPSIVGQAGLVLSVASLFLSLVM